jgi:hypothetical protein
MRVKINFPQLDQLQRQLSFNFVIVSYFTTSLKIITSFSSLIVFMNDSFTIVNISILIILIISKLGASTLWSVLGWHKYNQAHFAISKKNRRPAKKLTIGNDPVTRC